MPKHEIKSCLRCGTDFECKVGNVLECQCYGVEQHPATREYLAKTQYDCLCKNCLKQLNTLVLKAQKLPFPTQAHEFKEGLHYYIDKGLWVFTEFYHIQKGNCCENNCRHCAYGFKGSFPT